MVTIPLTQGFVALIDDEDAHLAQHKWHVAKRPTVVYAQRRVYQADGSSFIELLHQAVLGLPWVDHINRNGLDCRRSNLRPATRAQQQANRGKQANNTSGFKGVHLCHSGRWRAQVMVAGRRKHLGLFDTPEDAARAYDAAARNVFGEFACPNFPDVELQQQRSLADR